MGYRSDVAYTIRFNSEEAYRLFILEAKAQGLGGCFSNKDSFWDEAECDDDLWRIDFHAQGVKWYESYPDVQMHEKLLAQAREWVEGDDHVSVDSNISRYRIGYAFVRVGEDTEDCVEEHGGFADWDWLHVVRSIERNYKTHTGTLTQMSSYVILIASGEWRLASPLLSVPRQRGISNRQPTGEHHEYGTAKTSTSHKPCNIRRPRQRGCQCMVSDQARPWHQQ